MTTRSPNYAMDTETILGVKSPFQLLAACQTFKSKTDSESGF
jgi:hypothetical protein